MMITLLSAFLIDHDLAAMKFCVDQ